MAQNNDTEKKNVIKQAARKLFFQLGFNKTAMDDIARESGLAKPTLYYYYPGKEAIFNEVVIEEAEAFMNRVEEKIDPSLAADEKLARFFRLVYEGLKYYAEEMAPLPDYFCDYSPHGRPIVNQINELFRAKLLPLLIAGKQAGIFTFGDEETIATTLVFMTDFLNLEWMHRYPESLRDQIVDTMIDIILTGLKRRDG